MFGRFRVSALLCVAVLAAGVLSASPSVEAAPPGSTPSLTVTSWAQIDEPWDIAFMPDGSALVTSRPSPTVHVRRNNGSLTPIAADQSDFAEEGEGGMMGIVVDPDFAENRRYYTCQRSTSDDVRVIAWTLNGAKTAATRQSVLVEGIQATNDHHNGCRLRFGYEGYLWISTGDSGVGTTPQDLNSLAGKVLRVDPVTGNGHAKNPFFTTATANRSKVYTYGHRNPQGLDRRPCTNQMWSGEHGPDINDEINLLKRGGNYGWDPVPGYNQGVPMTDFSLPGRQRGAKWRSGDPTIALSGVGWIRGADWGGWDGELAGATLKNQQLWIFEFSNGNRLLDIDLPSEFNGDLGRLRVPVMGPDGALYVASASTGTVYRAIPTAGPKPGLYDVNGDGYDDLVVTGPGEDISGKRNAGGFHVLYGSAAGLRPTNGTELRHQGKLKGAKPQKGDRLGSAVAYGDIDGDGTTDIVVGAPREDVKGSADAGVVHVVCGRTNGIEGRSSQTFSQRGSVAGAAEDGDRFGTAVAMGDFDGDGQADVASGAPLETISGVSGTGGVTVLYGTPTGITTEGSQEWSQAGPVAGTNEAGDRFGSAVATGDFDGDGRDDLAVGVPFEDVGSSADAGAVVILYGSNTGLGSARSVVFDQTDTASDNAAGDRFGTSLVVGDFNNDGRDDLAVAAPMESVGAAIATGQVTVLYGSGGGLTTAGAQVLSQTGPVPGSNETGDHFGSGLGAGDIDDDGTDDLVVGISGENNNSGRIVVFDGSGSGLVASGVSFSQRGPIPGKAEAGDLMGASVRVADFNGDGFMDVAVGLPGEGVKGRSRAGAIVVLEGSADGLTTNGSRYITQATRGIPGKPRTGDAWGTAM